MRDLRIRCSLLGKIMTNPTAAAAKAGEVLSVGAKTAIRQLAAEDIFGVDFEFTSKETEKGNLVEPLSIALYNRVVGTSLAKNTERRTDGFVTGEPDLVIPGVRGVDIKSSWSLKTFPIAEVDAEDPDYEWQARGYMRLWDLPEWEVAYCMVSTPDNLIGFEMQSMHLVDHIPEAMRLTRWAIKRDAEKEALIEHKVKAARAYYAQVLAEFDRVHGGMPDTSLERLLTESIARVREPA